MSKWKFGKRSKAKLATAHPLLRALADSALELSPVDFCITCGHRTKEEQDKAVSEGKSKLRYPASLHNRQPAHAIDFCPCRGSTLLWDDRNAFVAVAAAFWQAANEAEVSIRWGGDFNRDGKKTVSDAWDLPHIELIEPRVGQNWKRRAYHLSTIPLNVTVCGIVSAHGIPATVYASDFDGQCTRTNATPMSDWHSTYTISNPTPKPE